MKHRVSTPLAAIGLLLAVAACGSDDAATEEPGATTAATASAATTDSSAAPIDGGGDASVVPAAAIEDRPLRVGVVTTLSGPAGYYGQDILDGFNLAIELSAAPVDVIVEDDEQDADVGLRAVERMLQRDDVDVVTGPAFSNVILAVTPDVLDAGKIFVGPNGGPSQYAGEDCDPMFFNVAFQTDVLAESVGAHMTAIGAEKPYIVTLDYQAGYDNVAGLKRTYTGPIAGEQYVPLGTTDFAAVIADISASDAGSLYVFLPGGPGVAFMKQYAAADLGLQIFATAANSDEAITNVVGEASVGVIASATWGYDLDNPTNKAFVEAFVEKYGRKPEMYGMQGYDAGQLLVAALEKLGGVPEDLTMLAATMKDVPFESPRGSFAFGPNNFPIQDWFIRNVVKGEDGKITYKTGEAVLADYGDSYAAECPVG